MDPVSVIIPTYNRRDSLMRALDALGRQTYPASKFEAVVVSDGSTDGTDESVRALAAPFALNFRAQANAGPSAARNQGAAAARHPLLVYLDDDMEPAPQFVEEHARAHVGDDALVLVGPQSGPTDEPMSHWVAWEHRMLQRQYAKFDAGEWEVGPNNLYSGNFSILRAHLLKAGGFNEKFTRQEDVELGFRLARMGLHFRFNPRASGIHRPTRSFDSWYRTPYEYGRRDVQMAREGGEERAMTLARKHYGERNRATRIAARLCIGRPGLEAAVLRGASAVARRGSRRAALAACSLLFNLRYLQGMCHELGGRRRLWTALHVDQPAAARPEAEGV